MTGSLIEPAETRPSGRESPLTSLEAGVVAGDSASPSDRLSDAITIEAERQTKRHNTGKEGSKKSRAAKRTVPSSYIVALSVLLLANLLLSFYSPIKFDAYKFPYRGWAWWAFQDLKDTTEVHNVVLLGSSLVVSAVAGVDANFLNKSLDLSQYHKASYLDAQMRGKFGGTFNTFNLSLPGQMPSDAYLALKAMVDTANRPDVVIYGVAPRDFFDSTMSSPADTEPFRYLRRLVNIDDIAGGAFRTPFARLEWFLQRHIYSYGYAIDFQLAFRESAEHLIARLLPAPYSKHPFTWWDRIKLLPGYMPGEIVPLAVSTGPIDEHTARHRWTDNTIEYMERYKNPDPHTYETQFYFLRRLAAFCRRERIELIVVNMPITDYNIRLLGADKYVSWLTKLKQVAFEQNIPLCDLYAPRAYHVNDFHDSVHLNAYGGKKMFDHLLGELAKDPRTSLALVLAGKELQRHQAVANRRPMPSM
ncbi:MAG TPA: hypothetical protein V6D17_04230 [Candidatus Obscuribacterales bacterium]